MNKNYPFRVIKVKSKFRLIENTKNNLTYSYTSIPIDYIEKKEYMDIINPSGAYESASVDLKTEPLFYDRVSVWFNKIVKEHQETDPDNFKPKQTKVKNKGEEGKYLQMTMFDED